jgi:hypothetical protein
MTVDRLPREPLLPLDDRELLQAFLIIIGSIDGSDVPTVRAAQVARTLFLEIANRWLPAEPFSAAFERLGGDEDEAVIAALDDPAFAATSDGSMERFARGVELTLVP